MATLIGHVTRDRASYWCGLPQACSIEKVQARARKVYDDVRVCRSCRRARRASGIRELVSDEEFAAFRAEAAAGIEERGRERDPTRGVWTSITHSCGHDQEYELTGAGPERREKRLDFEREPCWNCLERLRKAMAFGRVWADALFNGPNYTP